MTVPDPSRWPDTTAEDETLAFLAATGNRALALRLAGGDNAQKIRLSGISAPRPKVFVPVVAPVHPDASVLCPVEAVAPDEDGLLARCARDPSVRARVAPSVLDAVREAFADAWQVVRGIGDPPRIDLRAPLLTETALHATGPSIYLAAGLAAVARWGHTHPRRNVIATGHPHHRIDALDEKRRVAVRETALRAGPMLVASAIQPAANPEAWVRSLEEAARRVFGLPPLAERAAVRRVAVLVPTDRTPRELPKVWQHPEIAAEVRVCATEAPCDPARFEDDVARLVRAVLDAARGESAIELCIAAPLVMQFALGWRLGAALGPYYLRDDDGALVWVKECAQGVDDALPEGFSPPTTPARGARLRAMITNMRGEAGWVNFPTAREIGGRVELADVPQVVRAFDRWREDLGARDFDLSMRGPTTLAFALGDHLRNKCSVRLFHYDRGRSGGDPYVPWATF